MKILLFITLQSLFVILGCYSHSNSKLKNVSSRNKDSNSIILLSGNQKGAQVEIEKCKPNLYLADSILYDIDSIRSIVQFTVNDECKIVKSQIRKIEIYKNKKVLNTLEGDKSQFLQYDKITLDYINSLKIKSFYHEDENVHSCGFLYKLNVYPGSEKER